MHGATPNTTTYAIKESSPKKQNREQVSSLLTDFYNWPLGVPLQHFRCIYVFHGIFQVVLVVENLPASAGDIRDTGLIPGLGRSPGGGYATHSSILAWRIPWTEEPSGIQYMGSPRVKHDWGDLAHIYFIYYKWLARSSLHLQGGAFMGMNTTGGDHWEASYNERH